MTNLSRDDHGLVITVSPLRARAMLVPGTGKPGIIYVMLVIRTTKRLKRPRQQGSQPEDCKASWSSFWQCKNGEGIQFDDENHVKFRNDLVDLNAYP